MGATVRIAVLANAAKARSEFASTGAAAVKMGGRFKVATAALKTVAFGASVAAIAGVGAAIRGGVKDAVAYEAAQKKVNAALKVNAGSSKQTLVLLRQRAAALETLTGATQDENDILDAQARLLRVGIKGSHEFGQATLAAANLAAAGNQGISQSAKVLAKALQDPTKAAGALRRANVSLTKSQQDQIKKLVESGQTAKAQAIVLTEVNRQLAGQAEAAGKGTGAAFGKIKDTLQDTARDVAVKLLPAFKRVADFIAANLPAAIDDAAVAFGKAKTFIAELKRKLDPLIPSFDALKSAAAGLKAVLQNPLFLASAGAIAGIAVAMKTYGLAVASVTALLKVAAVAQLALNFVMSSSVPGRIVIVLFAVIGALAALSARSQKAREILVTTLSIIGKVFLTMSKVVLIAVKILAVGMLEAFGIILKAASKAFGWVPGMGDKLKAASSNLDGFTKGVSDKFDAAIRKTDEYKRALDKLPKVTRLKGDISDLRAKIDTAKAKLKDKNLTDPERSKIRADISDLLAKLRKAKLELAQLKGKNIRIGINTVRTTTGSTAPGGGVSASATVSSIVAESAAQVRAYAVAGAKAGKAGAVALQNAYIQGILRANPDVGSTIGKVGANWVAKLSGAVRDAIGVEVPSLKAAFNGLATQLAENFNTRRDTLMSKFQDRLSKLSDAQRKTQAAALAAERKGLASHIAWLKTAYAGYEKTLNDTAAQLGKLQVAHDAIAAKLDEARSKLDDAKSAFQAFADGVASSYAQLADLTSVSLVDLVIGSDADGNAVTKQIQTADNLVKVLADRAAQAVQFTSELAALQAQGLSADYVKQLASLGPDSAKAVVDALAVATPAQIAAINASQAQILAAGSAFGAKLAGDYYQSGIDSAQGLIDGLLAKQAAIEAAMRQLAEAANKAYRDALKIKSPSRVMAESGRFTIEGLVRSLLAGVPDVSQAMRLVAAAVTGTDLSATAAVPVTAIAGTGGGSPTVNINVQGAIDPVETGRQVIKAIASYERMNGRVFASA